MTREYRTPRGRLAAVAVALVCVAASVAPAAAGFVCGDACPKPPTPTYPYNNFSSPVTPDQVQLTQAVYAAVSAVPTVPATPSTAQKVFVPVFSTASSVAEQFTATTLPTMLASAVDVVVGAQASHQTAAVTLPALMVKYASTTNPGQKGAIMDDMHGQALGLHTSLSGAATAASNGAQANQALQTTMAPFLTATDTANSACGDAPGNVASLKSTLQADLAAFDACTTAACRSKYVAAVNSTLLALAAAENLATLCSSSWGTTLRALHTGVQQFNDDVAFSLRNFFNLRENALNSAASDASRLADNFTPSSFNATATESLLSDLVAEVAYSMGPCYHMALTACPSMCPPSTLA